MPHTKAFLEVLLISLFVLLVASPAGRLWAGDGPRTGSGPESGEALAAQTYLPLQLSRHIPFCGRVSEIPRPECEALVLLYQSTNRPGWTNHAGWLDTNIPSRWHGVTCEAGHVQRLDLDDNRLNGAIPPELGELANLKELYLSSNQLSGAIPPQIGNLASLRDLWLSTNELSGGIPPELGNLANLRGVYLYSNQLSGAIPSELGNLINLKNLLLDSNLFRGALPRTLMNLSLFAFYYDDTGLCEPPDDEFQTWLAGIPILQRSWYPCL